MVEIRQISSADVQAYKAVRLRALQSDPDAFESTYERELSLLDDEWLARCTRAERGEDGIGFIAWQQDQPIGLIGCFDFGTPGEVLIVSMWIAPEARRQGVASRLIHHAIDWARSRTQTTRVTLEVGDANASAIAFYERLGFVDTGRRQPMPGENGILERVYEYPINREPAKG